MPSVADRSINVQSCDVTVTLDVGLVPCSEDVLMPSSIGVKCDAGDAGQEISYFVQRRTVPCFYSIQAEDKRTCRMDMH